MERGGFDGVLALAYARNSDSEIRSARFRKCSNSRRYDIGFYIGSYIGLDDSWDGRFDANYEVWPRGTLELAGKDWEMSEKVFSYDNRYASSPSFFFSLKPTRLLGLASFQLCVCCVA